MEIYALPDSGLHRYGGFHLNLADGLERSIIETLKPEWNLQGNKKGVLGSQDIKKKVSKAEIDTETTENRQALPTDKTYRIPGKTFNVTLGKTYWNQGFFNVSVDFERYFGKDKDRIKISLGSNGPTIGGHINRSVNTNFTPRIMGGIGLRDWLHTNTKVGDLVKVDILSPVSIRLRKRGK